MKTIILFLIMVIPNKGQNLIGYYPLETGNRWEYYEEPGGDSIIIMIKTVVGDSIFSNLKEYKVIDLHFPYWNSHHTIYQRFNNNIVYQFYTALDSERVLYDFTKTTGDTLWIIPNSNGDTTVYHIVQDESIPVFGRILRCIDFMIEGTAASYNILERVADSVGLIYSVFEPGIQQILRGAVINGKQIGIVTNLSNEIHYPINFSLSQNYPNPFNPSTKIKFTIPESGFMSLTVYDILGNEVATLINEEKLPGVYEVKFDASRLSSGIYFYQLKSETSIQTKKMVLMK